MLQKFFIHIPKTGGMTVRHGISNILVANRNNHISAEYSNKLLNTMNKNKDHHGYEHARWLDIREDLKNSCEFFAIVRNPWAKVVSRYCFAKRLIEIDKKIPKEYADVSSFEKFLEERFKWGNKEYFWHRAVRGWYPQVDHVRDKNNNLKCNILRTEYLDSDLKDYFNLNNILKRRNITNFLSTNYKNFYNSKTKNIVGDWYAEDIEFFGFDFNSSAIKNIWKQE